MPLSERLGDLVAAAFPGIYVTTYEPSEAIREIVMLCQDSGWSLITWDIERGLSIPGQEPSGKNDPLAPIRFAQQAPPDATRLIVLKNYHRFLANPEVIQAVQHALIAGKQSRTVLVILAPTMHLPDELEREFVPLSHDMPTAEDLEEIARGVLPPDEELPEGTERQRILDAAAGLTRSEAEGAFALSLVRHGCLVPEVIWELKAEGLTKEGLLSLHRQGERFESLGGLTALKDFCIRALAPCTNTTSVSARGVLLLSPPGCGKSAFAKALGHETGRPTLILDVGCLMAGLVGQTEERTRRAIATIEAMSPCILMIDEVEKALSGVGSGNDSGVTTRMFGTLLTWLGDRDHHSDVFVVCTANDVSKLPPEFTRAERFDGIWYLDLPERAARDAIWQIHRSSYDIPSNQHQPHDRGWTGAEIASCCRLAALLNCSLTDAAVNVVPVSTTAAESLAKLRQWADGRCLDAAEGGIYRPDRNDRRRCVGDPSLN
ncbi:AAA family ATPase [Calycomorphotria hydatis]|uniref:Uncharacterized AAA domain-containing protein ycf46 n=1 Tax=Calycomorphotria hydatis TaxID=2528027 RepID=A0A517T8R6_9PLAN|nr:AAA family ATPase [Calycomorphotria hydatis]QDT64753.1 ATP-dependent zinc metalloprotease FtsH 3 [Calycomorphotria hydatis]